MRILRRLALVVGGILVLIAGAGLYIRHRVMAVPDWYHASDLDSQLKREAANDMDRMLIQTFSDASAAEIEQRHPENAGLPNAPHVALPICLQLTEDEMNSWGAKWDTRHEIDRNFRNSMLLLRDHQLILAGQPKGWDMVVALHFEPRVVDGKLNIQLVEVTAGTQSVPRWLWERVVRKPAEDLQRQLPKYQRDAEIGVHSRANSAALNAAMSEMLLHILHDEPCEPAFFVPEPSSPHGEGASLVTQIADVDISNKTLTIKITPMTADQRDALLVQLRGPDQNPIGMGK